MEKIKLKNKFIQNNIYNLYITFGTLPALYSQINVFLDKNPSYIWTRSGGTFISDKHFPNNLKFYKKFDGFNDVDFFDNQYKNIVEKINNIREENTNAHFNIFCDDSRIQFLLKIIIPLDLESFIDKIIIISEGNITEYMSRVVTDDYFEEKKMKWKYLIDLLKDKKTNKTDLDNKLALIDNYSFWLSTLVNVEYLIPNLNLLLSETTLGNIGKKMNLLEINFSAMYNKLPLKIRDEFINKAIGDVEIKNFFENNNKILIINGTYDFGNEEITTFVYSNLINKVIDDYGKKYTFFYKAHPLFPVEKNISLLNFLNKNNISFLPEKIPLEIILWEYKNIRVGGFCSSIHSLIPSQQVEFLFGELNGFSKYILKNCKRYNIDLSQEIASISLKYYYKLISFINDVSLLEEKLSFSENKIINIENIEENNTKEIFLLKERIENIEKNNTKEIFLLKERIENIEKNNTKEISLLKERIDSLEKFMNLFKILFYPIIWLKRFFFKLKENKK